MKSAPTEVEALDFVALVGHNGSTRNAKDVVTPGGAVCNTLAPTRKGQKLPDAQTFSLDRDAIEERAAIMAEGNGWSQGRAERQLAYERGFSTWHQMLRASK